MVAVRRSIATTVITAVVKANKAGTIAHVAAARETTADTRPDVAATGTSVAAFTRARSAWPGCNNT